MTSRPSEDSDTMFKAGLAHGRNAQSLIPKDAPFSAAQRAWLQGFLTGIFAEGERSGTQDAPAGRAPSRSTRPSTSPRSPHPPGRNADSIRPSRHSRNNPFAARIVSVDPVAESPVRVVKFALDLEGSEFSYSASDALGVFPQNEPDVVRSLLRMVGARGQETVETARGTGPIWRALLEELDVGKPTAGLLELLADVARAKDEREHLQQLLKSPEATGLTIPALLRRFPSARPRASEFAGALEPMQPSHYPLVSLTAAGTHTVEALATLESAPMRQFGRASDFVRENMTAGRWLPVFAEPAEGSLPDDAEAPVVLFASGANSARCQCFLQHRAAISARGRNWVFTDTRWFENDFSEWQRLGRLARCNVSNAGAIDALAALLEEQSDTLWTWIVDRSFLCAFGSESELAAISASLKRVAISRGRIAPEAADHWLEQLMTEGQFRPVANPE